MPLTPYLQGAAFDSQTIATMTEAFEEVLRRLGLRDRNDPVTEIIARRIIACAQQGERDPARLCELALSSLNR